MEWNEAQYERMARWLDGENVELTADERGAAEEIRALERRAGSAMDVAVPPEAMQRAHRRARSAALGLPRRAVPLGRYVAAAAAVAAMIVLTFSLVPERPAGGPGAGTEARAPLPELPMDAIAALAARDANAPVELDALSDEIASLRMEMAAATLGDGTSDLDGRIETLQESMNEFWIHDPLLELES